MRGGGVSDVEKLDGPGRGGARRRSGRMLGALAAGALGAGLVVALGLGVRIFESGSTASTVRAAYTRGLEAGLEAGSDADPARLRTGPADTAEATTNAGPIDARVSRSLGQMEFWAWVEVQRALGADPARGTLGPQSLAIDGEPGGRAVVCAASRCAAVASGPSLSLITLQGGFQRRADQAALGLTRDEVSTKRAVAPVEVWWEVVSRRADAAAGVTAREVASGSAPVVGPTLIGERLICDQNTCMDTVTGASVSVIRIQGRRNSGGLDGGGVGLPARGNSAAGGTDGGAPDAAANYFGPGAGRLR